MESFAVLLLLLLAFLCSAFQAARSVAVDSTNDSISHEVGPTHLKDANTTLTHTQPYTWAVDASAASMATAATVKRDHNATHNDKNADIRKSEMGTTTVAFSNKGTEYVKYYLKYINHTYWDVTSTSSGSSTTVGEVDSFQESSESTATPPWEDTWTTRTETMLLEDSSPQSEDAVDFGNLPTATMTSESTSEDTTIIFTTEESTSYTEYTTSHFTNTTDSPTLSTQSESFSVLQGLIKTKSKGSTYSPEPGATNAVKNSSMRPEVPKMSESKIKPSFHEGESKKAASTEASSEQSQSSPVGSLLLSIKSTTEGMSTTPTINKSKSFTTVKAIELLEAKTDSIAQNESHQSGVEATTQAEPASVNPKTVPSTTEKVPQTISSASSSLVEDTTSITSVSDVVTSISSSEVPSSDEHTWPSGALSTFIDSFKNLSDGGGNNTAFDYSKFNTKPGATASTAGPNATKKPIGPTDDEFRKRHNRISAAMITGLVLSAMFIALCVTASIFAVQWYQHNRSRDDAMSLMSGRHGYRRPFYYYDTTM